MPKQPRIGPLCTDLYELTMAAAYFQAHVIDQATFSLLVRPSANRNFYVAAGLETALDELSSFGFTDEECVYLKQTNLFSDSFIEFLSTLHFRGDVMAMPEGAIFFGDEPIMEVTAPIIEAQLVETLLLNILGSNSLFATKGARCIHVAQGRPLVDFALRRTQGHDAGLRVARSTSITGFAGTSNVQAGSLFGIPVSGTMAHSYVTTFKNEIDAFRAYARVFPDDSVFLIDTYDTVAGAKNAAIVGQEMKQQGHMLKGVRLDSGDLVDLSSKVRAILDTAGLANTLILASGGLDEYEIKKLLKAGACIDAFGVGTAVGTSADAPHLDIVYKLVRFSDRNIRKLSPGKQTLAGEKQVFRKLNEQGKMRADIIGLRDEKFKDSRPLLSPVMRRGKIVNEHPTIRDIQDNFKSSFTALEDRYKSIHASHRFPVYLSDRLRQVQEQL